MHLSTQKRQTNQDLVKFNLITHTQTGSDFTIILKKLHSTLRYINSVRTTMNKVPGTGNPALGSRRADDAGLGSVLVTDIYTEIRDIDLLN